MTTRCLILVAVLIATISSAHAQVLTRSGDKLGWDQTAVSLTEAQGFQYILVVDEGTPQSVQLTLQNVTCTKLSSNTIFPCSAPMPALTPGSHTLKLKAVKMTSLPSTALSVNRTDADPRCAFPTGTHAISIFPTRLTEAGQRAQIQFQLGSPGSPVGTLTAILRSSSNVETVAGTVSGPNLNEMGSLWFNRPTTPGTYVVRIQAVNQLGCSLTVTSPFSITVQ